MKLGSMTQFRLVMGMNHPSIIKKKSSLPYGNFFTFTNVTVNEIYNMLMKMDCKNSTGFDDIPGKLLKMGSAPLARTICNLINLMLWNPVFQISYNMQK